MGYGGCVGVAFIVIHDKSPRIKKISREIFAVKMVSKVVGVGRQRGRVDRTIIRDLDCLAAFA